MKVRLIKIFAGDQEVTVELNQSQTADLIWNALPVQDYVQKWGDEIYFAIPVESCEMDARDVVDIGDVGYWPPGQALCLFFGFTPASTCGEIRPASPVNLVGRIKTEPTVLRQVSPGESVRVECV